MMLSVETQGSGPDLVLLHGWGAGSAVWKNLAGELAQRFRVHAVDAPGYGRSPGCSPYTLERIARQLADSLPTRCLVCAWSLGGQIALAWAAAAPLQVARLALIAVTPCFAVRADWPHAVAPGVLRSFSASLQADCAGTLRRFALLQARNDDRARTVARRLREALATEGRATARALDGGLRLLMETDLRKRLPAVAQPVLVMHGERDTLVPLAAAQSLCSGLPDARLAVITGASHAPFLSSPRETGTLLAGFFA